MQSQEKTSINPVPHKQVVAILELDNAIKVSVDAASLPFIIGRDTGCDLCIPSSHISRHHCTLYLVGNVLWLKDTSTNGTNLGQQRLRQDAAPVEIPVSVLLANEISLTVKPCAPTETHEADRCEEEFERRGQDRRSGQDRRQEERRAASRY